MIAFAIRLCNCLTLGILSVYVEELYPTPVRNIGSGL